MTIPMSAAARTGTAAVWNIVARSMRHVASALFGGLVAVPAFVGGLVAVPAFVGGMVAVSVFVGGMVAVSAMPVAAADDGIVVLSDVVETVFADSMQFELSARSAVPVEDAVLRFRIGVDSPTNRRIPVLQTGTTIKASHTEDLSRGEIPPASLVTWWWTLTDEDGRVAETEPRSIRYLDERFDWRSTDGEDVRVWWYDGEGAVAEEIAEEARVSIDRLGRLIGALPDRPIEIVVYASQDDMRPALTARGDTYESRLATLGARVAPDILVLDAGTRSEDLFEVLAHELSHIVLHLRFGNEYLNVAAWLDEGLAMYSEGPLDKDERGTLDRAITDDDLMSVRSLSSFPGEAELVPLAYAESRDLVAFLIDSYGEDRFRQFIDAVAAGQVPTEAALEEVYGFDQLGLYQAYRGQYGLEPASEPAPGAVPRRQRRQTPSPLPCASILLLLPAFALALGRSRSA